MALEDLTGTKYIDDLNSSNPSVGDNISEGDDHIRGIKNVLKTTFPSIDGAITATDTELNYVDGVTSAVQTQLDAITANDWVTNARLADDAVDSAEIVDGAVDLAHMSANSVDSDQYVDGSIDRVHLAADIIDGTKIANDAINSEHYAAGSIDAAHIASNTITATQLAADCVGASELANDSVGSANIIANSITAGDIAANAIGASELNSNVVNSEHYVDYSIDGIHLALDRRSTASTHDVYHGNAHDYMFSDASHGLRFYTSNSEEMRLENDGDLHVDGNVIAYSTTVSDERLKENIQPIEDALNKVNQLKGCTFTYTPDGKQSAGLIAQEVEKVLPSAVTEKELPLKQGDGKEYKVLQYDQTIGLLVEAIKELTAKVEELEGK